MEIEKEIEKKLKYLKTSNIYSQFELETMLVQYIADRIKKNPKYLERKNDVSLVKWVCLAIEEVVNKKKKGLKPNKLQICLDVFNKVFVLNDEDTKELMNHIEFLHSDNQLKKVKIYFKLGLKIANWISKKI